MHLVFSKDHVTNKMCYDFILALQNNDIIGCRVFSYMFVSTEAKCGVISKLLPPVPLVPFSRSPGSVPVPRRGLSGPLFLHNDSPPPQSYFSSLTFVWHGQMETEAGLYSEAAEMKWYWNKELISNEAIWHPEKNNCNEMTCNSTEYKIHAFWTLGGRQIVFSCEID